MSATQCLSNGGLPSVSSWEENQGGRARESLLCDSTKKKKKKKKKSNTGESDGPHKVIRASVASLLCWKKLSTHKPF